MTTDWKAIEEKYYMFCVRRQPIVIVRGEGTRVWDDEGKEYLDFTAGWAVNNVGHANAAIADAVAGAGPDAGADVQPVLHGAQLELAQLLVDNSCLDKVFFCNSGAEANEGAFKLARKYGKLHRNGAYEVITAQNSFHGRTLSTWSATGKPHDEDPFLPLPRGFVHVRVRQHRRSQGGYDRPDRGGDGGAGAGRGRGERAVGGLPGQPARVVRRERAAAHLRRGPDGTGQAGDAVRLRGSGVEPDVMTLAKGLGGGVPIGAFLAKDHAAVFEPLGEHGSTFGGNALTCAAAAASTRYMIDNDVPSHAHEMGEYMQAGLRRIWDSHDSVTEVRGVGLLIAVEFSDEVSADLLTECNGRGLLLNAPKPTAIRIMPPLTITKEEIDAGLERLDGAIGQVAEV